MNSSPRHFCPPGTGPLSPIEQRVLDYLRQHDGADEHELLTFLFPPPAKPRDGTALELANWRAELTRYEANLYGSEAIQYTESYAYQRAQACISLRRRGLIKSHNNGFNSYCYELDRTCAPAAVVDAEPREIALEHQSAAGGVSVGQ